jgi:hypothetical protein
MYPLGNNTNKSCAPNYLTGCNAAITTGDSNEKVEKPEISDSLSGVVNLTSTCSDEVFHLMNERSEAAPVVWEAAIDEQDLYELPDLGLDNDDVLFDQNVKKTNPTIENYGLIQSAVEQKNWDVIDIIVYKGDKPHTISNLDELIVAIEAGYDVRVKVGDHYITVNDLSEDEKLEFLETIKRFRMLQAPEEQVKVKKEDPEEKRIEELRSRHRHEWGAAVPMAKSSTGINKGKDDDREVDAKRYHTVRQVQSDAILAEAEYMKERSSKRLEFMREMAKVAKQIVTNRKDERTVDGVEKLDISEQTSENLLNVGNPGSGAPVQGHRATLIAPRPQPAVRARPPLQRSV